MTNSSFWHLWSISNPLQRRKFIVSNGNFQGKKKVSIQILKEEIESVVLKNHEFEKRDESTL